MSEKETNIMRIIRAGVNLQDTVINKVPEFKRRAGEGRIGKLVVDDPGDGMKPGPEHTIAYFKVKNGRLVILDEKPDSVRNEIIFLGCPERGYTGVQLFTDGIYQTGWFRYAYTQKWLIITDPFGDLRAEYDSEEMIQLCEDMLAKIAINLTREKSAF
jgi:hypothetical protein